MGFKLPTLTKPTALIAEESTARLSELTDIVCIGPCPLERLPDGLTRNALSLLAPDHRILYIDYEPGWQNRFALQSFWQTLGLEPSLIREKTDAGNYYFRLRATGAVALEWGRAGLPLALTAELRRQFFSRTFRQAMATLNMKNVLVWNVGNPALGELLACDCNQIYTLYDASLDEYWRPDPGVRQAFLRRTNLIVVDDPAKLQRLNPQFDNICGIYDAEALKKFAELLFRGQQKAPSPN